MTHAVIAPPDDPRTILRSIQAVTRELFPAFADFQSERAAPAVRAVYRYCLDDLLFSEPREIKVWAAAESLATDKEAVIDALNWLAEQGYLVEHERGERGVRRFTLAWRRNGPVGKTDRSAA